jgi:hypothetical protein
MRNDCLLSATAKELGVSSAVVHGHRLAKLGREL